MNRERTKLITFGRSGHTTYHNANCRTEGYESPETLFAPYHWWAHPADQVSYHVDPGTADGAWVIDMRPAVDTAAGYKHVFMGPLVNVDLPDGEADTCPDPSPIFANAVSGNQFGTHLAYHAVSKSTQKRGSLDSVSIREYVDGWRAVGARIGRVVDNAIVWE